MFFSGARFSNYEAWCMDPIAVTPSAHIVTTAERSYLLNVDVGGGLAAIQITSGFFHLWHGCGILNDTQLFTTSISALGLSLTFLTSGWAYSSRSLSYFSLNYLGHLTFCCAIPTCLLIINQLVRRYLSAIHSSEYLYLRLATTQSRLDSYRWIEPFHE